MSTVSAPNAPQRLASLRQRLDRLCRARYLVRAGTGLSQTVLAVLLTLVALFCCDWGGGLSVAPRLVVMSALGAGLVAWFWQHVWSFLRQRETLEGIALIVEREHAIDNDLIAALQFEQHSGTVASRSGDGGDPGDRGWGSVRLTTAVIEYVADFTATLDVFKGFTWQPLPKWSTAAGLSLAVAIGLVITFPDFAQAFARRLLLQAAHYPTRTVVDDWQINGHSIAVYAADRTIPSNHRQSSAGDDRSGPGAVTTTLTPDGLAIAQGESLTLTVRLRGEIPTEGHVLVRGSASGERAEWSLTPPNFDGNAATSTTDPAGAALAAPTTSRAATTAASTDWRLERPTLSESVWLQLVIGDVRSDPVLVRMVPRPLVTLAWQVTPPTYAQSTAVEAIAAGSRQFAVLQGSRLRLRVLPVNKPLRSVKLLAGAAEYALLPVQGDAVTDAANSDRNPSRGATNDRASSVGTAGTVWELPAGTALADVQEPTSYRLEIVDEDGLSPEPAIAGQIRLTPDRAPRVAAAIVSKKVLPGAQPKVSFGAVDDFGLKQVRVVLDVVRADGSAHSETRNLWTVQKSAPTTLQQETAIDLSPLKLAKGDEVRLMVEAEDHRGVAAGMIGRSDPLVLEVTDRNGILAGLLETDQLSAKQLDAIIQRELGIGGTKR